MTEPKEGYNSGIQRAVTGTVDSDGVWTEGGSSLAIIKGSDANSVTLADNAGRGLGLMLDDAYHDPLGAVVPTVLFTGSVLSSVLTVESVQSGVIETGQILQFATSEKDSAITAQTGGTTGGAGTYSLSIAETATPGAGTSMWLPACIRTPTWANFVSVTGHIEFPAQLDGDGFASVHLFRNGRATPPQGDMAYHGRQSYITGNLSYTSIPAVTGKIPVVFSGELWSLRGLQQSGASQTISEISNGGKNWLSVEFFV